MMPVMTVNKFERFFGAAAGLDVDKKDLKRYSIQPSDLPITKGLLAELTPLNLTYTYETEERLPSVVGGLSVALARTCTIIDTELKNPSTKHWKRAFRIFDLLL